MVSAQHPTRNLRFDTGYLVNEKSAANTALPLGLFNSYKTAIDYIKHQLNMDEKDFDIKRVNIVVDTMYYNGEKIERAWIINTDYPPFEFEGI